MTRVSIGNSSTVYADTGEVLPRMDREQALKWMKQFAPEYASTITYDAYLESHWAGTNRLTCCLVLRVRYNDENQTWLYFTPSLGQMVKFDKRDRANR